METQYRKLHENEICRDLFGQFIRRQKVEKCWRKEAGKWVIKDAPFIDDWSESDYKILITCLKNTAATDGLVYGFFCNGQLKGFVSVESTLFGAKEKYLDLTSLHISEDMRAKGLERYFFLKRGHGQRSMGQRSFIFLLIPLWRHRLSIRQWDVWRHRSIINSMWKRNLLTASWNFPYS